MFWAMGYFMYTQDLDVDEDVKEIRVKAGEYLILDLDFSPVRRSNNLKEAAKGLADEINDGVELFHEQNHPYSGKPANKLISGNQSKKLNI